MSSSSFVSSFISQISDSPLYFAHGSCSFPFLPIHFIFHTIWMTIAWLLCCFLQNGSMVDFGWPSGFFLMALSYLLNSSPAETQVNNLRGLCICVPYLICGARFMGGWIFTRRHYKWEDARWAVWRQRWRAGKGWFGFTSVALNFFFFYHAQGLANSFIFSLPLHFVVCSTSPIARSSSLSPLEIICICSWLFFFTLENVADVQLGEWKKKAKKASKALPAGGKLAGEWTVCREGLWRYSRHPNYFCELMLWVSYALFASASTTELWQLVSLSFTPLAGYYFLVEFTGVFMAEQASLAKRGESYAKYMRETSMLIPWIPNTKTKKSS